MTWPARQQAFSASSTSIRIGTGHSSRSWIGAACRTKPLHADDHRFDPSDRTSPYAVVFNRMSPSAYLRGRGHSIFYTLHYLAHLEKLGVRVVNGAAAWRTETSKALQLALLESLGLPYPRARVIHHPTQAPAAAHGAAVSGRRQGRTSAAAAPASSASTRRRALRPRRKRRTLDLGIDSTALVQEYVPADGGRITRVEVLGGKYLYAIRVYTPGDSFNLCPADVCQSVDGAELARAACPVDAPKNGLRVEGYTPPPEIDRRRRADHRGRRHRRRRRRVHDRRPRRPAVLLRHQRALELRRRRAARRRFRSFARLADWLESELRKREPPGLRRGGD